MLSLRSDHAMPPLLIDITRLLGRLLKGRLATGVDRVDLAYVEHYGPLARAVVRLRGRSIALSMRASQAVFEQLVAQREALPWSIGARVLRGALSVGRPPLTGSVVFNTGHSGLHQPAYARHLRAQGLRPVFMVHDLIPITHHEYCRAGERERHMQRMDTVLDTAAGVVTNSQATLDELARYALQRGKPMPPAQCARLAPGLPRLAPGPRPIVEPYFVVLGTIELRKNHWMLLQVWRRLVERLGPEAAPRLVVIGQRGWECENVIDLLERCEPLRGVVIEQASCTDADLTTWLHHAQALLFPSFVEGYGLPLVEALMLGTPVIASDLPVFREIAADIPDYLDPLDGPGWMDRIERYAVPESPWRAAQRARMVGFVAPTWAEHFDAVDALLERLHGQRIAS